MVACGQDVHGGGVGADGGGVDPWGAGLDGEIVEQVAGFEVVGGVEDDVCAAEEGGCVGRGQIGDVGCDSGFGVDLGEAAAGSFGLGQGFSGVLFGEEHLTLEVGGLDEVAVDDGEVADAGPREQTGGSGSGGSAADEGNVSGGELLLASDTDGRKKTLPGIAIAGCCGFRSRWSDGGRAGKCLSHKFSVLRPVGCGVAHLTKPNRDFAHPTAHIWLCSGLN